MICPLCERSAKLVSEAAAGVLTYSCNKCGYYFDEEVLPPPRRACGRSRMRADDE